MSRNPGYDGCHSNAHNDGTLPHCHAAVNSQSLCIQHILELKQDLKLLLTSKSGVSEIYVNRYSHNSVLQMKILPGLNSNGKGALPGLTACLRSDTSSCTRVPCFKVCKVVNGQQRAP